MVSEELREFVAEQRAEAPEHADFDAYYEFLYGQVDRGLWIAFGLVAFGEVAEAKRWFPAVATAKTGRLNDDPVSGVADYIDRMDITAARDLSSSMKSWYEGLLAAIMSADRDLQRTIGDRVYEALTADVVDSLDRRGTEPHIDMDVALAALLSGREVDPHLAAVRRNVLRSGRPEYFRPWGLTQVEIIEALQDEDPSAVAAGLAAFDDFHREHWASSELNEIIRRELNFPAIAYVALARQRGLGIDYESEFVPEAVTDPDHYPVGDR